MSQTRIVALVLTTTLLAATALPAFAAPTPTLTTLPWLGNLARAVMSWIINAGAEGDPDGRPFDSIGILCEPGGGPHDNQ